jgi:putative ABC transport system ATP-binding protein
MALIELRKVSRVYRTGDSEFAALDGVDLSIERGEFVAVTGSSGSGKSTLMNVVGCLDRPTTGEYRLNGRNVAQLSRDELAQARNQTIGFVFQNFNLLPRTRAIDNVELPLIYAKVPAAERHKRAAQALERVGLGHRRNHRPSELSGGQQQRVAIARAIVSKPPLILADEPTGNLDTATSNDIMKLLTVLCVDEGITVVLVTHEADIAAHAKRKLTLRDGKIIGDEQQPGVSP